MNPTCDWHCGTITACTNAARHTLWDPTAPRPIGFDEGNPLGWSTDKMPMFPTDYADSLDRLCDEHARVVLRGMTERTRDYLLDNLAKCSREISALVDSAFTFGGISSNEAMHLAELVIRHHELLTIALEFLQQLRPTESETTT